MDSIDRKLQDEKTERDALAARVKALSDGERVALAMLTQGMGKSEKDALTIIARRRANKPPPPKAKDPKTPRASTATAPATSAKGMKITDPKYREILLNERAGR